jgi:hypothetical protein
MYGGNLAFDVQQSNLDHWYYLKASSFMRRARLDPLIVSEESYQFEIKKFRENQDWCAYGFYKIPNNFPIFFLGTQSDSKKLVEGEIFLPSSSIAKGLGYHSFPGQINFDIVKKNRTYIEYLGKKSALYSVYILFAAVFIYLLQFIKGRKAQKPIKAFGYLAIALLIVTLLWKLSLRCT